jgi:hypothetical protein
VETGRHIKSLRLCKMDLSERLKVIAIRILPWNKGIYGKNRIQAQNEG